MSAERRCIVNFPDSFCVSTLGGNSILCDDFAVIYSKIRIKHVFGNAVQTKTSFRCFRLVLNSRDSHGRALQSSFDMLQ